MEFNAEEMRRKAEMSQQELSRLQAEYEQGRQAKIEAIMEQVTAQQSIAVDRLLRSIQEEVEHNVKVGRTYCHAKEFGAMWSGGTPSVSEFFQYADPICSSDISQIVGEYSCDIKVLLDQWRLSVRQELASRLSHFGFTLSIQCIDYNPDYNGAKYGVCVSWRNGSLGKRKEADRQETELMPQVTPLDQEPKTPEKPGMPAKKAFWKRILGG